MANPNYDNAILGSGIAGLTVFYYLAELTKTRNILITKDTSSQTTSKFPLGPRFLHFNKDTEALLRRLGLSTKTKEIFIGYKDGKEVRNYPTDEFKQKYALKSRGTSKVEGSFLSGGGKSSFTAFETSQIKLADVLSAKCKEIAEKSKFNVIAVEDLKSICHKKIVTSKNIYYSDDIVSTIPLSALLEIITTNSVTFKMSTTLEEISFYLVDEKGKGYFDYVYSVDDTWHRKTYVPELDNWVYEVNKTPYKFEDEFGTSIKGRIVTKTQVKHSLNLKELGNIKLVGRYAQMNHAVKTEDIIHWAYNYTRRFKKND